MTKNLLISVVTGVGVLAAAAAASPSSGEKILWHVLGGGGVPGTSANFAVSGTVGQTSAGPAETSTYHLNSGFWQNFSLSSCCVGRTGNIDCDVDGDVDIADLSRLIDHLYITLVPLCCEAAANVDGDSEGQIDIADISRLIDYMYISFTPPALCK